MTGFLPLPSVLSTCQHGSPRELRGWAGGACRVQFHKSNGHPGSVPGTGVRQIDSLTSIVGNGSRVWGSGVQFLPRTLELMGGLYLALTYTWSLSDKLRKGTMETAKQTITPRTS